MKLNPRAFLALSRVASKGFGLGLVTLSLVLSSGIADADEGQAQTRAESSQEVTTASGGSSLAAARIHTSEQRSKRYILGFPGDPNFKLNPLLKFRDHLPPVEHPFTGLIIGKWLVLDPAPPILYGGFLLPTSIRDDAWYVPTTLEITRIPGL